MQNKAQGKRSSSLQSNMITLTASASTSPTTRSASSSSAIAMHSGGRPDSSSNSTIVRTVPPLQIQQCRFTDLLYAIQFYKAKRLLTMCCSREKYQSKHEPNSCSTCLMIRVCMHVYMRAHTRACVGTRACLTVDLMSFLSTVQGRACVARMSMVRPGTAYRIRCCQHAHCLEENAGDVMVWWACCKGLRNVISCLKPENKMTLCEPHSRPRPQVSGLGCDQSTSGSFMPFSTDRYSMSPVQGMTLTRSEPAESKMHLMMAHSSALKPASRIACSQHDMPMTTTKGCERYG